MTGEIIKDMLFATDYPPYAESMFLEIEALCTVAHELADYIASQNQDQKKTEVSE